MKITFLRYLRSYPVCTHIGHTTVDTQDEDRRRKVICHEWQSGCVSAASRSPRHAVLPARHYRKPLASSLSLSLVHNAHATALRLADDEQKARRVDAYIVAQACAASVYLRLENISCDLVALGAPKNGAPLMDWPSGVIVLTSRKPRSLVLQLGRRRYVAGVAAAQVGLHLPLHRLVSPPPPPPLFLVPFGWMPYGMYLDLSLLYSRVGLNCFMNGRSIG